MTNQVLPRIPSILMVLLFVFSVWSTPLSDSIHTKTELSNIVSESSSGGRHLYTFADGSTEAIALYQTGTPARIHKPVSQQYT